MKIEGLPEGWELEAIKINAIQTPRSGVTEETLGANVTFTIKKKQPRRIVLEETEEKYLGNQVLNIDGIHISIMTARKWREVNETDLSLHNDDDKESLRLSVDECKEVLSLTMNGLVKSETLDKLRNFIKDSK